MKNSSRYLATALVTIAAALLASCSSSGPVEGTPAPTTSATPTPTAAAAAPVGSREAPFPLGTPGKYSDDSMWTVTWKSTDGNAWAAVRAENEYNEPPAEGNSFVLGTLNVAAEKTEDPAAYSAPASLAISYVGNDGNTYAADGSDCGVFPGEPFYNLGDMYGGAAADATVCTEVPSGAIAGGSWRVESLSTAQLYSFFAGA